MDKLNKNLNIENFELWPLLRIQFKSFYYQDTFPTISNKELKILIKLKSTRNKHFSYQVSLQKLTFT